MAEKKETKKTKEITGYNIEKSNGKTIYRAKGVMSNSKIARYKAKGYKVLEVTK